MSINPREVPTGAVRYNTDSNKMEVYIGSTWMEVSVSTPNLDGGSRAIRAGGQTGGSPYPRTDTMDFVTIPTAGNATDFGNLTQVKFGPAGAGSRTRAVFMAGGTPTRLSEVDFVTFSSTGNAADFGDMTQARAAGGNAGNSNETRAYLIGGSTPSTDYVNTIDFITIASTGNAVDFGDDTILTGGRMCVGSPTRGLNIGGSVPGGNTTSIDFITIAQTGNAQDFGELTANEGGGKSCSNQTRALSFVGTAKRIESTIIATLGNAIEFGELTQNNAGGSFATSDPTRGLFGLMTPGSSNTLEYISISTGGTAVDFGDLTQEIRNSGGTSNAHGGL